MAILAIGLIGGEIFSGVGLSFGLGFAVFGTIAELLLAKPAKPPVFKSMTSAWGDTWPIVYNNFRIAGKVIQASTVTKHPNKAKKGGTTYSQTFALGLCEGVRTIGRIWADNLVIYDPRPITDPPAWQANHDYGVGDIVQPTAGVGGDWQFTASVNAPSGGTEPSWLETADGATTDGQQVWIASRYRRRTKVGQQYNFTLRIYTGTETQVADSALEEIVGVGKQPAYRGLCYLVFENFDLSKYGERIPNFEVEILSGNVPEVWEPMPFSSDGAGHAFDGYYPDKYSLAPDFSNNVIYLIASDDAPLISKNDATTGVCLFVMHVDFAISAGNNTYYERTLMFHDGHLYFISYPNGGTGTSIRLSKIDPSNMQEISAIAVAGGSTDFGVFNYDFQLETFSIDGVNYGIVMQDGDTTGNLEVFNLDTMTSVCTGSFAAYAGQYAHGLAAAPAGPSSIDIFTPIFQANPTYDLQILKFTFTPGGSPTVATTLVCTYSSSGADFPPLTSISPAGGASGVVYDESDNSLILIINQGDSAAAVLAKISTTTAHVVWATQADVAYVFSDFLKNCDVSGGSLLLPLGQGFATTNTYMTINMATGAATTVTSAHFDRSFDQSQWIYNGATGYLYYNDGVTADETPTWPDGWAIFRPGTGSTALSLGTICRDMSKRVGLADAQLNMTDLDGVFPRGAALLNRDVARSFLESMQPAFFYDLTDIGDQIVGSLRSTGSILEVIPESDLAASTTTSTVSDKIASTRVNDIEIPKDLSVSYYDSDHDYQAGSQQAKRNKVTQFSSGRNTITVPVVMNPGEAANAAERSLYLMWVERTTRKFSLPVPYNRRTPADVVALERGGREYAVRITKMNLQPSLQIDCEGVSEDLGTYSLQVPMPTASIATGSFNSQTINPIVTPVLALLDTAMLRSSDLNPGIYVAGCASEEGGGWDGESVQESQDNSTFSQVGTISAQATLGTMVDQLGDFSRWTVWDNVHTVRVTLLNGALGSDTADNLVNNFSNLCWTSNGEIFQFMTATFISGSTYALSGLLRGRFGTEQFVSNHEAGETFVMLDSTLLQTIEYSPSEIGALRFWKGVNDAATNPETAVQTVTMATRRLMPFAPYFMRGSRDLSGNLSITGLRRMRWRGAPLWKPQESDPPVTMQIDIMSGSVVLRTLTSTLTGSGSGITDATGFTAYYSATDQTTDFGSPQASLSVMAYEINAIVGRGYPGSATL